MIDVKNIIKYPWSYFKSIRSDYCGTDTVQHQEKYEGISPITEFLTTAQCSPPLILLCVFI